MGGRDILLVIPPPIVYIAAFLIGLLLDRWWPGLANVVFGTSRGAPSLRIAAVALLVAGAALGPLNALRFLMRGTTLNPNRPADVFLTRGLYAVSRNPMYLGLFLIYIAVALLNGAAWPLATIVIPFLVVDRIVIPFEEAQMERRFGASYRDYRARVGRWVTVPPLRRA